ncbi:hypothetical protein BC939DRAFT_438568 [Gamsiella multidivaricata]|uniref:uncharacterized protein n=1 Tax=Gamsiella multidivaricata TaxID=101098 RepID=UPI00221FD186|nr:uncharacterized protein BC939DRAFT_438568 [Gamsiella multidivaricata]KAI7830626.1 hypothetical protein BC939DRAFT_438568 [Gamsiella multidivaricata]
MANNENTTKDQVQGKDRLSFSLRSISFSHYNEKARWALDYYGVPYVEYRSLPLCHIISMYNYRAKVRPAPGSSPFVTPFLMGTPTSADASSDEKIIINDSTQILQFLSDQYAAPANSNGPLSGPANLYSDDEATKEKILALEERFDAMIGPHIRRYMYYEILCRAPSSVGRGLGQHGNAGALQKWVWTLFFPLISWALCKAIRINEKSAARSKDILRREFEHVSRVLESGPPGPAYLVGNQLSAADLTFASLAGLAVGVTQEDGLGAWVPPVEQLGPEAREFCEELRQTTAGKHVLECYKLHRGQKAPGSSYGYSFFGLW